MWTIRRAVRSTDAFARGFRIRREKRTVADGGELVLDPKFPYMHSSRRHHYLLLLLNPSYNIFNRLFSKPSTFCGNNITSIRWTSFAFHKVERRHFSGVVDKCILYFSTSPMLLNYLGKHETRKLSFHLHTKCFYRKTHKTHLTYDPITNEPPFPTTVKNDRLYARDRT